jgi:kinesin family member 2/24
VIQSSQHKVDRLFGSGATTKEIYADLVRDLVCFAQSGGIGTLFTYGQTGSGKTFTISQLQQMAAETLMTDSERTRQETYITVFDLAGNAAFDLLDSRKPFPVLEDSTGNTQLAGAKEYRVHSLDEILDLITQAASYRRTASTTKNDASSRSHCICRIRLKNIDGTADVGDGTLYLVDLAGSEAARDVAEHGADRMRETREINMSLSVLKDCIRGKAELDALKRNGKRKKMHMPVRQSTLTKVLKHVFDPQAERKCRTVVLACVNPSLADVGPSKNTLRFAEMLRAPLPKA